VIDLLGTRSSSSKESNASSSISIAASLSLNDPVNNTRSVNLFDLIDEEFVVNRCTPKSPVRRKKRLNILDMIDRIDEEVVETTGHEEKEDSSTHSSSFMTERSYPRGVFVVPPTSEQYLKVGNVGFVAAEAFELWTE
jgi:hypothetical protein